MGLRHLKFYTKTGSDCTPLLSDEGYFKFTLNFNRVSTGLFEVEHIFIFEDILKVTPPKNISKKQSSRVNPYTSTEIKILKYLRSFGKSKEIELTPFFPYFEVGVDPVGDFFNQHLHLFSREFESGEFWVDITAYGTTVLLAYEETENEYLYETQNLVSTLVRPRGNFSPAEGEDNYLFFKWKDYELDNNLFAFLVDSDDSTIYFRGEKAVCNDDGKKYPSIIPLLKDRIHPDISSTWRQDFRNNYVWDRGNADNFEMPQLQDTIIYNTETQEYELKNIPVTPINQSKRILNNQEVINQVPLQINLAVYSETEGELDRVLEIYLIKRHKQSDGTFIEESVKIAEITCLAEVIGKDERLQNLLENFGRGIDETDSYVYRNTDVDEDNPDYIIINEKNKELLLSGNEIYPYLGSYKGFYSALKWLGYQDLIIREYFYNVKLSNPRTGRNYFTTVDLPANLTIPEGMENTNYSEYIYGKDLLEDTNYRKIPRYDLIYQINKWTGEFDEYNYPVMEDNFIFTPEEVLVKLYGLKNVLQKYFLPHNARIINIAGEGVYFAKYKLNFWTDINPTISLKYDQSPKFEAVPLVGYLKRLDQVLTLYRSTFNLPEEEVFTETTTLESLQYRTLEELATKWINKIGTSTTPASGFAQPFQYGNGPACCNAKRTGSNYYLDLLTGDLYQRPTEFNLQEVSDFDCGQFIVGNCPWKYVKNLRRGEYNLSGQILNFDNDVTFDKIISFYPSYESLKNAILEHLINVNCYDSGRSTKTISALKNLKSNKKLLGMPVLIRLIPNVVTWNDLDIPWDHLDLSTPTLIEQQANKLFTWDGIGNYDGYHIRWNINHSIANYCYQIEGILKDFGEVLCFLPEIGFYDVACRVTDITNFPHISRKKNYIEVKPNPVDFIAFGRWYENKETWEDLADTAWDDAEVTWNNGNYCPDVTTWDDCQVTWNDLEYGNYMQQRFTEPYEKSTEIIDIDDVNNKITVKGLEFQYDYSIYKDQWWRNVIVLENTKNIPLIDDIEILSVTAGKILINNKLDLKIGEQLKIYKKEILTTDKFMVSGNTITCKTTFASAFEIGNVIKLNGYLNGNVPFSENYKITDFNVDYISGLITVTVDNDGSLNHSIGRNPLENITRFYEIELEGDVYLLRIEDVNVLESTTMVSLEDPRKYLGKLKNQDLSTYRCAFGVSNGRYTWEIANVEADLTNQTSIITFNNWNEVCYITTNFLAKWAEFDFDWAQRYGTSRQMFWDNFDNITWDQAEHQTWDSMDFYGNSTMGFYITKIMNGGSIKLNHETVTFDFTAIPKNRRISEAIRQLSRTDLEMFSRFEYNVIRGKYIKATAKVDPSSALCSIRTWGGVEVSQKSTYPQAYFNRWEEQYFPGYNNPATWNPLKRDWVNNGSNFENWENDEMVTEQLTAMEGSFTMQDTFIKSEDFSVPTFTPVFIIFNGYDELSGNAEFEWELWEDTRNKLMGKSKYQYLIWNFVTPGAYTVKLTIKTNNSSYSFVKKSWIRVTNDI